MKGAALLIVAAAAALSAGGAEARLGASAPQYVLDAAAMGAPTDCSQFGRRAADKQGVPEIKASPCEIGGTAAKAETCTHTELCILEYVGQEVHKAVQAVNAHLPDTMKENMEIAVSSATAVAEGCMGAYVELEESKHWLMGYAMSAGEYFAEKVGSTTFEKMKSFFTNWVKGKKVAPAPAGATPADEAEAEALAEDKMEAIFLHSALFMRSLQLRAALIAIAENKGGFGGREIDPAHVKLLAKAADSLPKTMADLSALAKSLEASKNEERLRNFMRWGVQVAADTGLGIGAATVYPFVAAGLKNAGLPTLGDLAADALVFDTQTRNNFQLVLASIQATCEWCRGSSCRSAAHNLASSRPDSPLPSPPLSRTPPPAHLPSCSQRGGGGGARHGGAPGLRHGGHRREAVGLEVLGHVAQEGGVHARGDL